jgi:hypothetical protein
LHLPLKQEQRKETKEERSGTGVTMRNAVNKDYRIVSRNGVCFGLPSLFTGFDLYVFIRVLTKLDFKKIVTVNASST